MNEGAAWDAMAITVNHFQQIVVLIKAVSCRVSAQPPMKRKPSLSPTQQWKEKCSVATHTTLAGRISVPNIWALFLLRACGLLSPCLICSRGWGQFNRERPPCRVRLRSLNGSRFCQSKGHLHWACSSDSIQGEKERGECSKDFLFVSGIRVLEWQRAMSRTVLSSCLTWESCRLPDFIILKSFPESKKVLLFWLRLFFVSTWTKLSVQTSYLATLWVSRGPIYCIYILTKREKRHSLGIYFSFLYWEKQIWVRSDLYCWIRYYPTLFRKNDSGNKNLRHWATFMCIRPLLRTDF